MSEQIEMLLPVEQPRLVRDACERRLAAIGAENKRRMELARRTPSVPLATCTCGRPAILVADGMHIGRYEVHCEGYWDATGWTCPEGRCTDLHTEIEAAAEAWNAGRVTLFGLANTLLDHP